MIRLWVMLKLYHKNKGTTCSGKNQVATVNLGWEISGRIPIVLHPTLFSPDGHHGHTSHITALQCPLTVMVLHPNKFIVSWKNCKSKMRLRAVEMGQWVKAFVVRAWQPEFDPWNPTKGRRREMTLQSCPLTSTCTHTNPLPNAHDINFFLTLRDVWFCFSRKILPSDKFISQISLRTLPDLLKLYLLE